MTGPARQRHGGPDGGPCAGPGAGPVLTQCAPPKRRRPRNAAGARWGAERVTGEGGATPLLPGLDAPGGACRPAGSLPPRQCCTCPAPTAFDAASCSRHALSQHARDDPQPGGVRCRSSKRARTASRSSDMCVGLQEPNRDTLVLYARFIGDTADYVLNQLIETTLAKDREFVAWRAEQLADAAAKLGARVAIATPARHAVERQAEGDAMRTLVEYRVRAESRAERRRGRAAGCTCIRFPPTTRSWRWSGSSGRSSTPASAYTYATLWFSTPFFVLKHRASRALHLCRATGPPRDHAPLPPYPAPEHRAGSLPGPGRAAPPHVADAARATPSLARHSRARPLHRHRSSSAPSARARPRPACIPTSSNSSRTARSDPAREGGRPGPGGERRLLPAGPRHPAAARPRPTTTSRSVSTRRTATTRCTTIWTPTRWPTASPRS